MSQWRGQIENIEEPGDVVDLVGQYYHVPTVLLLVGFMLWSRVRDWKHFLVDGTVYFSGNDPWYHYRMVSYTVRHWPETSPFDPWTYFPYGSHSSQFGTIMDQIVATAALVVGLGSPTDHTVRLVALFAPAVFGTAIAVPVYFIGRRASNRFGGVLAVGALAFVGSTLAQRSTVGFYDHHVAEALFMTLAVLATMIAVSAGQKDKPVWELFEARDVAALRRPVGWSLLAGVATAAYIWTWPPGVFLLGILGAYYLIELTSEVAHGESPEHVAIIGAISLSTTGVLTFAAIEEVGIGATSFSLLQPGLAFAVAAGCAFLAWFARLWERRDLPAYQYPAAVAAIIAVLAGLTALVLPDLFGFFVNQTTRVIGLDVTDTAGTIGEAQPLPFDQLFSRYQFTLGIGLLGVGYLFARHFYEKPRAELSLLAVWTVFLLLATLTQRRFDYYFGVSVAVMTGLVVGQFVDYADLFQYDGDIETYQVLTVVAIVLVVFAPLLYPTPIAMQLTQPSPIDSEKAWNESLDWMQDNTPEEGNLGGAGNDMPYYGTFERTDDFDYEDGFYGVLSWWDYGHWITSQERIPNANPFQQGANEAANFLLSPSEERAETVRDRMSEDDAETRYVMVDWKMVSTESFFRTAQGNRNLNAKYPAPFQFYDDGGEELNPREYFSQILYPTGQQTGQQYRVINRRTQKYYNSTAVRLYQFHGSAVQGSDTVLDWNVERVGESSAPVSNGTIEFDSHAAAEDYVENDTTSQVGGFGANPSERVPAMEHYRLVSASETSASSSNNYLIGQQKVARGALETPLATQAGTVNPSVLNALEQTSPNWVKVFERVPGATIEGEGPANTTVSAAARMHMPSSNTSFVYRQQAQTNANGEFAMTVPYSTTGYDEWTTEEGYTSPNVTAEGPYQFQTGVRGNESGHLFRHSGSTNVTEGQVIGEDSSSPTVTLERNVLSEPQNSSDGASNGTDSNDSATNGTESSDSESLATAEGDSSSETGTGTGTESVAEPGDSALEAPSVPDSAALLPLLGAGVVSLVTVARRG